MIGRNHHRWFWRIASSASFLVAAVLAVEAAPPKPAAATTPKRSPVEIVRAIAYLMRVADNACPGVAYDPAPMVKMADAKSATVLQVRVKFRDDFQKSYDEAGVRIAADGVGGYCDIVIKSYAPKPREFPGLKIK